MKKTRSITKTYIVEDVTCDICGKKFDKEDKKYSYVPYFSIKIISDDENSESFEYYDNFIIAKQQDICKKCSKKISDKFCEELHKLEEKYNDLKFLKEVANDR